jgi:hypothetical protein
LKWLQSGAEVNLERYSAIETQVGRIDKRNSILATAVDYDLAGKVTIKGKLDLSLCSKTTSSGASTANFSASFDGVQWFSVVSHDYSNTGHDGTFGEVVESGKIEELRSLVPKYKINETCRHFYLWSYDDTFEIVCARYEFDISAPTE